MSSKKNEKWVAEQFLKTWNKKNNTDYVIDENYLNKREESKEPDIKIVRKSDLLAWINIEVTHAEDNKLLEAQYRTWEKMVVSLREIIHLLPRKDQGFIIGIHAMNVRNKQLVKQDLEMFKTNVIKYVGKKLNPTELKQLGYKTITTITGTNNGSPYFVLGGEVKKDKPQTLFSYYGYFERLENALKREKDDLIKKGKNIALNTILLVEIDASLRDEIKYAPIKESEIEDYCYFANNYISYFKDIFVVESILPYKVFNIKDMDVEMFYMIS